MSKIDDNVIINFDDLASVLDALIDEELEKQNARKTIKTESKSFTPAKSLIDHIGLSIYISHPYTGEPELNLQKASTLASELQKKFPDIAFFNPLGAFHHFEIAKVSYEDCLKHCMYWLHKCDGVLMAPQWEKSKGCRAERQEALKNWMPVWDNLTMFAHAMENRKNSFYGLLNIES